MYFHDTLTCLWSQARGRKDSSSRRAALQYERHGHTSVATFRTFLHLTVAAFDRAVRRGAQPGLLALGDQVGSIACCAVLRYKMSHAHSSVFAGPTGSPVLRKRSGSRTAGESVLPLGKSSDFRSLGSLSAARTSTDSGCWRWRWRVCFPVSGKGLRG